MTAHPIRIAIVGLGKIARDQHLPAIAANPAFTLAATVSPHEPGLAGTPHFHGLDDLLASGLAFDAVALCTPPQVRHALASAAIAHGVHVLLEKPPGATLSEVAALDAQARARGITLFASWHSRYAAGVARASAWLADRTLKRVSIAWREDVRVWHPGQAWIWQPGGLGVFDPGINALSIATHILPSPIFLTSALLKTPANREAPIAAELQFSDHAGTPIAMDLDWRQTGPQSWDIEVETDAGTLALSRGGAALIFPGESLSGDDGEYRGLYAHFAALIAVGQSNVDIAPLRLVADAFLLGRTEAVAPFHD